MKRLLALFPMLVWFTASAQIGQKITTATGNGIEGTWSNTEFGFEMVLMLNKDGSGEFDGDIVKYKVSRNQLDLITEEGTTTYQFILKENRLTLSGGDLEKPITFSRLGQDPVKEDQANMNRNTSNDEAKNDLTGKWEGNNEVLEFRNGGIILISGVSANYSVSGNQLTITGPNGSQTFGFKLQAGSLTIQINGQNHVYYRSSKEGVAGNPQPVISQPSSGKGRIAPELVGKWCYINVSSSSSGGWTTDECIVINADGTYEYNYESSGSVSGYDQYGSQTYSGGTGSQSHDQGTWRLDGNTLYVQSQSKGNQVLTLQKVNNPKNGDPMIVIDGRAYVTYYQKPSW